MEISRKNDEINQKVQVFFTATFGCFIYVD